MAERMKTHKASHFRARLTAFIVATVLAGSQSVSAQTWEILPPAQIQGLSVPLPGSPVRVDHSFSRQPLHFERNDGQVDAEAKFLARGPGYQLFLTQTEAVMVLREPNGRGEHNAWGASTISESRIGTLNLSTSSPALRAPSPPFGMEERGGERRHGSWKARSRPECAGENEVNARPHPGPLPQERENRSPMSGDTDALSFPNSCETKAREATIAKATSRFSDATALLSLSPGERAGVRASVEPGLPVSHVLRMRLAGANPRASLSGEETLRAKVNYFIGNNPSLWQTNNPTFGKVRYHEVYPGIDLVFYGVEGQLEYDFVVAPGADPRLIALEFEGADEVKTDEHGDLVLAVERREVRWCKPVVYQEVNGARQEVVGAFRIGGSGDASTARQATSDPAVSTDKVQSLRFVSFQLAAYDPALPLVIDPKLVYSTYLGGSGADDAHAVAVDRDGNAYVGGSTTSLNFPTKAALNAEAMGGGKDVFVTKLSPTGELLFSTYLGGNDNDDYLNYLAISPSGECYVAGATGSPDFPIVNPLQPGYGGGEFDVFVTALKPDGSDILFSTYLGGVDRDTSRSMAFGPAGDVYVVGLTRSPDFPTRNAFQSEISPVSNGTQLFDGFITRLEARGKSILYSTFYGRRGTGEIVRDVAVDGDGNAYVVLWVFCADLECDEWLITKISQDGSSRLFETRWRDSITRVGAGPSPSIALGPGNKLIVAGSAGARHLPALNQPNLTTSYPGGYSDGYVVQFDATSGAYISAVYFGGSGNDYPEDVCVDAAGNIIVVGSTAGHELQTSSFPVTDKTEPAPDPGKTSDVFVTKFRSTDSHLLIHGIRVGREE